METFKVTFNNIYNFWKIAEGNPIKTIRFEHTQVKEDCGYIVKFIVKHIVFKNNPDITYIKTDTESYDNYFEEPINNIKAIIPQYLHSNIIYFFHAQGIFIILKGDIGSFPINDILDDFYVEFLDSDKLGLCHKSNYGSKEKCFDYLRKYKNKV